MNREFLKKLSNEGIAPYVKVRACHLIVDTVFENQNWALRSVMQLDRIARSFFLSYKIKYQYRNGKGDIIQAYYLNKGYQIEALDIQGEQRHGTTEQE